ncbi:hypothetical protein T484DRAFT_1790112 [Baffinella frigidus]|nr:hypothetical protein T484DRAFT_1790112 [Cryptophyta sp. CCMP2293]
MARGTIALLLTGSALLSFGACGNGPQARHGLDGLSREHSVLRLRGGLVRELLGCFGCGGAGHGSIGAPIPGSPKRTPSLRAGSGELDEAASELVDGDLEIDSTSLAPGEVFLGGFLFKKDHGMLPVWQRRFVTLRHGILAYHADGPDSPV